jgi:hypothetical protein
MWVNTLRKWNYKSGSTGGCHAEAKAYPKFIEGKGERRGLCLHISGTLTRRPLHFPGVRVRHSALKPMIKRNTYYANHLKYQATNTRIIRMITAHKM